MNYVVTEEARNVVKLLKVAGVSNDGISRQLGICEETLLKYYGFEVNHGRNAVRSIIMGALMKKVLEGCTASTIFAAKTICGLKETNVHEIQPPKMIFAPPSGEIEPPPPIYTGEDDD